MLGKAKEYLKWLDPFTYVDYYVLPKINPSGNKAIETIVYVVSAFVFAFVLYNFVLAFILGTKVPLVIVFSGSMEPILYRGDVVVLTGINSLNVARAEVPFPISGARLDEFASLTTSGSAEDLRHSGVEIAGEKYSFDETGPIVVYTSNTRGQDIIHRAVLLLEAPDGEYVLTLGDNNARLDQDCSSFSGGIVDCINLTPINVDELKGKYLFHLPLVGHIKLLLFDDLPWAINCFLNDGMKENLSPLECSAVFDVAERQKLMGFS